jgi:hypothetical protein
MIIYYLGYPRIQSMVGVYCGERRSDEEADDDGE